jgi:hypothetical protein
MTTTVTIENQRYERVARFLEERGYEIIALTSEDCLFKQIGVSNATPSFISYDGDITALLELIEKELNPSVADAPTAPMFGTIWQPEPKFIIKDIYDKLKESGIEIVKDGKVAGPDEGEDFASTTTRQDIVDAVEAGLDPVEAVNILRDNPDASFHATEIPLDREDRLEASYACANQFMQPPIGLTDSMLALNGAESKVLLQEEYVNEGKMATLDELIRSQSSELLQRAYTIGMVVGLNLAASGQNTAHRTLLEKLSKLEVKHNSLEMEYHTLQGYAYEAREEDKDTRRCLKVHQNSSILLSELYNQLSVDISGSIAERIEKQLAEVEKLGEDLFWMVY